MRLRRVERGHGLRHKLVLGAIRLFQGRRAPDIIRGMGRADQLREILEPSVPLPDIGDRLAEILVIADRDEQTASEVGWFNDHWEADLRYRTCTLALA